MAASTAAGVWYSSVMRGRALSLAATGSRWAWEETDRLVHSEEGLAQPAVGVLVGAPLPGVPRVAAGDRDVGGDARSADGWRAPRRGPKVGLAQSCWGSVRIWMARASTTRAASVPGTFTRRRERAWRARRVAMWGLAEPATRSPSGVPGHGPGTGLGRAFSDRHRVGDPASGPDPSCSRAVSGGWCARCGDGPGAPGAGRRGSARTGCARSSHATPAAPALLDTSGQAEPEICSW
jgi:hypothetical protein